MEEDAALLRRYVQEKSEEAFAALVRRHLDLVYSVALRQVAGDTHLAEDVSQRVFTALARKAAALTGHTALSGWLHRSTYFVASDLVRAERRRRGREQEVHAMNSSLNETELPADWEKIRPTLDAALAELDARERAALALRFFDGLSFAGVGERLRLSENAARMRVERALDKLRRPLARRGVTSTGAALAFALASQTGVAAPAGLATVVTGSALAAASGGGFWTVTFFTMSKLKLGIAGAAIAAGLTISVVELQANRDLRHELQPRQNDDWLSLQEENRRLQEALAQGRAPNSEVVELARARARITTLQARPAGVTESALRPASSWRNVGRATPQAATETFHWALHTNDLDVAASFVTFSEDTKENRDRIWLALSEATRAKYRTLERAYAAAFLGAGAGPRNPPDYAMQLFSEEPTRRFGEIRTRVWYRTADGTEFEGGSRLQRTAEGEWAFAPDSLARDTWRELLRSRFDPATGELLPFKK